MNNIHNNFSVQIAKGLSQIIHSNQKDKSGDDYMLHVLKVAGDVEHLGPDYYIVGLLHDAIEDAGENKTELLAAINSFFNSNIQDALASITKRKGESYLSEYLPRVKENEIALMVKIADATHNLSRNKYITDKGEKKRLYNKYVKGLRILGVSDKAIGEI